MRVLLTGSAGAIGSALRRGLPALGWQIRGLDLVPAEPLSPDEEVVTGDVLDQPALDGAMAGVAAVVHLASVNSEAPLDIILDSHVRSTGRVLDSARRAGVRRVVLASSNHAAGFTPRSQALPPDTPPRPDTFYGVGKVAMEALGRLYVDRYGLAVACLRIGTFRERPVSRRQLSTWLSPDDAVRLVQACLTSPALDYAGYAIVWGISANTRGWWDLEPGRALGYHPRDDAEQWAEEILAGTPEPAPGDIDHAYVGGSFTGPDYDTPGAPPESERGRERG